MTSANAPSLRDALIVAAVAALLIVSPIGRHLIQGQELYIVRSGAAREAPDPQALGNRLPPASR